MQAVELISLILMAIIYIIAGVSHFRSPKFFLKIMPTWVPRPKIINMIVGGVEIVLGIGLLFGMTRQIAALGVIALLIAVFPANVYHFQLVKRKGRNILPTLIRLPIQLLLIYWASMFIEFN